MIDLKPWALPLLVLAIALPLTLAFLIAGPALGVALGFLAVTAIVWISVRQRPQGPIETATAGDGGRRLLIVLADELSDPVATERIADSLEDSDLPGEAEVLLLAPVRNRLLDRWATDLEPARAEAQRRLVLSAAALGKAGVAAEAAVGEEGLVQAVEDRLREFPADEVILVGGPPGEDRDADRAAAELSERLQQPFARVLGNRSGR